MCVLIYADTRPWDGRIFLADRAITPIMEYPSPILPKLSTNAYRDLHIDYG
jgi:hypothetical protein